jgi:hypothetical protein
MHLLARCTKTQAASRDLGCTCSCPWKMWPSKALAHTMRRSQGPSYNIRHINMVNVTNIVMEEA